MNQQINLYLPEYRVKKDPVTALLMGQIVGGLLVLMLLVTAYHMVIQWNLDSQLLELRATLAEETQRTSQLGDELARRSQNTALTNRLERAEARLEASIQIRDFLGATQLGNVTGFSEHFKDLSRAAFDGISLTEFAFSDGGRITRLEGQATDSAMVPRYVDNIEQGFSPLSRQQFSSTISRTGEDNPIFQFELTSGNE